MEKNILIYGGGRLGLYYQKLLSGSLFRSYKVIGFIDDTRMRNENHLGSGIPLMGGISAVSNIVDLTSEDIGLVLAIGYKNLKDRFNAFRSAKRLGVQFLSIVHPSAIVSETVQIGEGSFVGPGAVLDIGVSIGRANFIDAGCVLSEDVILGDGNYLSPNVVVCGRSKIGKCNFLGALTCVRDEITIGDNNHLNMQTLLIQNLKDDCLVTEARDINVFN